ncbi:MAG: hypothetical protein KDC72_09390, partial [Bacteroidetes bacterium]|nr:hypothetical protein [Bacteroidota bacterium]
MQKNRLSLFEIPASAGMTYYIKEKPSLKTVIAVHTVIPCKKNRLSLFEIPASAGMTYYIKEKPSPKTVIAVHT